MKFYCAVANDSIEFKGRHFSQFPGKKNTLFGLRVLKIESCPPMQLTIFLEIWEKILKITHPVKYSYLPPWRMPSVLLPVTWCVSTDPLIRSPRNRRNLCTSPRHLRHLDTIASIQLWQNVSRKNDNLHDRTNVHSNFRKRRAHVSSICNNRDLWWNERRT